MRKERRKTLSCHLPKCCHEALSNLLETSMEQPFSGSESTQLVHAAAATKETEEVKNSKQGLGAKEVWKQLAMHFRNAGAGGPGSGTQSCIWFGTYHGNAAINTLPTLVPHCFEEHKGAKIHHFHLVSFVIKNWVK